MNPNTSPIMNFGQQVPYGYNPQTPGIFAASTPVTGPQGNTPLHGLLKLSSESVIPKIDKIEQSLSTINRKISEFDNRMSAVESKVNDIEKSCIFISEENDARKSEFTQMQHQVKNLDTLCKNAEAALKSFTIDAEKSKDELLDIKYRSTRENLIFYGIPENPGGNTENCKDLVKDLIKTHLELDTDNMILDRAHRLGAKAAGKVRPIVVKFHNYNSRETVRVKSFEPDVKTALKNNDRGIGIQSPQEYRDARKAFYPLVKEAEELERQYES